MKIWLLTGLVGVCALMAGCNRSADNSNTGVASTDTTNGIAQTGRQAYSNTLSAASQASNAAGSLLSDSNVDNTRRNVRDRVDNTLTPGDQGASAEDRGITQKIRQAIVQNPQLSTTAKNIKIITVNGKVTLRGPVNSADEQKAIDAAAQNVAGGASAVDDQLEVKATNQ